MNITDILALIVETALLPILAWGVAEFTKYLSKKIENETTEKYIKFALDAVHSAVKETAQTYVSSLKSSGEWNEETAQIAFENAKAIAIVTMGKAAQEAVQEMTGDIDAWLEAQIEASTYALKGASNE